MRATLPASLPMSAVTAIALPGRACSQAGSDLSGAVPVPVGGDDRGALGVEPGGQSGADPAGRSGDDDVLAGQFHGRRW